MIMFVIACIVLGFYALCNVAVALLYTPKSLARDLWVEQKWYGKIAANIFYAPAWVGQALYVGLFIGFYWIVKGIALGTLWIVHRIHNGYTKALRGEF